MQRRNISHPILGEYEQLIFDTPKAAGHVDLASQGRFGWEIPPDLPTNHLLESTANDSVLDLGCGWGNTVVIPAMQHGASSVYALDVTPEHIDVQSPMIKKARELEYDDFHAVLLPEDWWYKALMPHPAADTLLQPIEGTPPPNGTIDVMTARHVLHFGSPDAILNVLDLASLLLSPTGRFIAINFTPYVEFIYKYDRGKTLSKIVAGNAQYREGELPTPSGYLSMRNPLGVSLAKLLDQPAFNEREYLCFDDDTLHGLFNAWVKSREKRNLTVDLEIETSYLFSPTKIAAHNSMTAARYQGKENHYFSIKKKAIKS